MGEFDALDVVRHAVDLLREGDDFCWRDVEKFGTWLDKPRIGHGQAIRSIFGLSRVTHPLVGTLTFLRVGRFCARQAAMPPSR